MGVDLPDEIPQSALQQYNYYMDTGRLRIHTSNMKNANTREHLEMIKNQCLENLSRLPAAPGAAMTERPPLNETHEEPDEELDERGGGRLAMERRRAQDDLSDNEDDYCGYDVVTSSPPTKRMRMGENSIPPTGVLTNSIQAQINHQHLKEDFIHGPSDEELACMSSESEVDPEVMRRPI